MKPGAIAKELKKLERKGEITSQRVVNAARNESHPLHGCFEWDDTVAGEKWRNEQARRIIRTVEYEVTTENVTTRAAMYIRKGTAEKDQQGYITLPKLLTDEQEAAAAMSLELDRALRTLARAERIAEALGMAEVVREISARIVEVWKKVA